MQFRIETAKNCTVENSFWCEDFDFDEARSLYTVEYAYVSSIVVDSRVPFTQEQNEIQKWIFNDEIEIATKAR